MEEYHYRVWARVGRQGQLTDLCALRPVAADPTKTEEPWHPTGLAAGSADLAPLRGVDHHVEAFSISTARFAQAAGPSPQAVPSLLLTRQPNPTVWSHRSTLLLPSS
jgi:hypothetical protein